MKINSELPLCMLDLNNDLNEYDFVLFHLFESNMKYKEYYLNQRIKYPERLMIFDNSAYEYFVRGEQLNLKNYFEAICELKPDIYILPDVLMDKEKTTNLVIDFMYSYYDEICFKTSPLSKPMAVIQGDSEEEFVEMMKFYKSIGIKNIAVPFHNSFFKKLGEQSTDSRIFYNTYGRITEDILYALGRIKFMKDYGQILNKRFEHIHILGSHCPLEKVYYKDFDTMDTGYPVKCGIKGIVLRNEREKPDVIIDEFLEKELDQSIKDCIETNIKIFKNW